MLVISLMSLQLRLGPGLGPAPSVAQLAAASIPTTAAFARPPSPQRQQTHSLASTSGRQLSAQAGLLHGRGLCIRTCAAGPSGSTPAPGSSRPEAAWQGGSSRPGSGSAASSRPSHAGGKAGAKRQKRSAPDAPPQRGILADMFPDYSTWSHTLPAQGRAQAQQPGALEAHAGGAGSSGQGAGAVAPQSLIPDVLPEDPSDRGSASGSGASTRRRRARAGHSPAAGAGSSRGGVNQQAAPVRQRQGSVVLDDIDMLISAVRWVAALYKNVPGCCTPVIAPAACLMLLKGML